MWLGVKYVFLFNGKFTNFYNSDHLFELIVVDRVAIIPNNSVYCKTW